MLLNKAARQGKCEKGDTGWEVVALECTIYQRHLELLSCTAIILMALNIYRFASQGVPLMSKANDWCNYAVRGTFHAVLLPSAATRIRQQSPAQIAQSGLELLPRLAQVANMVRQ